MVTRTGQCNADAYADSSSENLGQIGYARELAKKVDPVIFTTLAHLTGMLLKDRIFIPILCARKKEKK